MSAFGGPPLKFLNKKSLKKIINSEEFVPYTTAIVLAMILLFFMLYNTLHAQGYPDGNDGNNGKHPHLNEITGEINSAFDDLYPTITGDGKTMIFNSKRGGRRYHDLFISHLEDGKWTAGEEMAELNSPFNDETPYITPEGDMLLFASDRDGSLEMPRDEEGRIRVSYDIYWSKKEKTGKWSPPKRLPGRVNTLFHERFPRLTPDKKLLTYSTWPFGQTDRAKMKIAKNFGGEYIPVDAPPERVNSGNKEVQLVYDSERHGFYFPSTRSGGMGGWDIYFISYDNGKWGEVENLGPGVNSSANDVAVAVLGDELYLSSDRPGGKGGYDIVAQKKIDHSFFELRVIDKKTREPLSATVEIIARDVRLKPDETGVNQSIKEDTDDEGLLRIRIHDSVHGLGIFAEKEGYLPFMANLDADGEIPDHYVVELSPLEKDASFDVHDIHFDYDSSVIQSESFPFLDSLAEYLKRHESMRLEIIGHTDLTGSDEYNDKLSHDRAVSVRSYLVKRGVDESRFPVRGAGKREPILKESSEKADKVNRRTEFRLLN